ncbi:hypothetical protein ACN27E_15445 [Mycobacterium sp. WMMD1722]|uniref:hypothetical protein n=1 Tax=Mycobacterium sp. WMMD1722 TaxID=3404117 RepID=UPI003BF4F3FA
MKTRLGLIAATLAAAAVTLAGPAHAASTVHGDAEAGSQNWSEQQYDNDCGLMSLAHLIGRLTGNTPSEEDIIAMAATVPSVVHDGPVYVKPGEGPSEGLSPDDAVPLAERYGVNVVMTWDVNADETGWETGMPALERYLDESGAAIAGVDADLLWDIPDGGMGGHSVLVTEIDDANGVVHLNDSGRPGGADEQISIDTFEAAWAAENHPLIIATAGTGSVTPS